MDIRITKTHDNSKICSIKFTPPKWEDCKTLTSKVAFIFALVLRKIGSFIEGTFTLTNKVIQFLYIDKLFQNLGRVIRNIFEFIFNNKITTSVSKFTYEKILTPMGRFIKDVAHFFFCTLLRDNIIQPIGKYVIKPLCSKLNSLYLHFFPKKPLIAHPGIENVTKKSKILEAIDKYILSPIGRAISYVTTPLFQFLGKCKDVVVKPLSNYVITPIINFIGELFTGLTAGLFHTTPKKVVEKKKDEEEIEIITDSDKEIPIEEKKIEEKKIEETVEAIG